MPPEVGTTGNPRGESALQTVLHGAAAVTTPGTDANTVISEEEEQLRGGLLPAVPVRAAGVTLRSQQHHLTPDY